jgi:hypothetical protein
VAARFEFGTVRGGASTLSATGALALPQPAIVALVAKTASPAASRVVRLAIRN